MLIHIADQQVGNGHAGIRRLGLITHQSDGVSWCVFADGFCGNDTGRAGANDDVMGHGDFS